MRLGGGGGGGCMHVTHRILLWLLLWAALEHKVTKGASNLDKGGKHWNHCHIHIDARMKPLSYRKLPVHSATHDKAARFFDALLLSLLSCGRCLCVRREGGGRRVGQAATVHL